MSKKEIESLEEIKKHLASLEQFDFKLLNQVVVKLRELEVRRKEDHVLLLRLAGTVEDIALSSADWKILRRTVVWIVTILSGFLTYFFGKD